MSTPTRFDLEKTDITLLSRYEDASALLRDTRFVKNLRNVPRRPNEKPFKPPWGSSMFRPLERNMLDVDAPDHDRLKSLVHKAFTPKWVEGIVGTSSKGCAGANL